MLFSLFFFFLQGKVYSLKLQVLIFVDLLGKVANDVKLATA